MTQEKTFKQRFGGVIDDIKDLGADLGGSDGERVNGIIRGFQHALTVADEMLEKAKVECGESQPSSGHDWVDELCGLFRVTRLQRDGAIRERDEALSRNVECAAIWARKLSVLVEALKTISNDTNDGYVRATARQALKGVE